MRFDLIVYTAQPLDDSTRNELKQKLIKKMIIKKIALKTLVKS